MKMPKVQKKTGKKGTATEGGTAVAEKEPRVKLADLPPKEKEAKAHELIDSLYGTEGTTEEDQIEKRKLRARLRTLDAGWLETYAKYIETNYPAPEPEPAPAKPAATAKPAAKGKGK